MRARVNSYPQAVGRLGAVRPVGWLDKNKTAWLIGLLGSLAMVFTRPTAFGEVYSQLGSLLALACAGAGTIINLNQRRNLWSVNNQIVLAFAYSIYLAVLFSFTGSGDYASVLKGLGISVACLALMVVIFSRDEWVLRFFDCLAIILIISSIFLIITYVLLVVLRNPDRMIVYRLKYTYPPPAGYFLFPFTMRYNETFAWFGLVPRLTGFFRESGIFPAFACWAGYYSFYRKWGPLWCVACLLASVQSGSSLGLPLAALTGYVMVAKMIRAPNFIKIVAIPILAVIFFYSTYNVPYIGLGYKMRVAESSVNDRQYAMSLVAEHLNIFGEGFNSDVRQQAITLISSIPNIGIIGFLILMGNYLIAAVEIDFFAGALAPMLITVLFSEPIYGDYLTLFLFMSWRVFRRSA